MYKSNQINHQWSTITAQHCSTVFKYGWFEGQILEKLEKSEQRHQCCENVRACEDSRFNRFEIWCYAVSCCNLEAFDWLHVGQSKEIEIETHKCFKCFVALLVAKVSRGRLRGNSWVYVIIQFLSRFNEHPIDIDNLILHIWIYCSILEKKQYILLIW